MAIDLTSIMRDVLLTESPDLHLQVGQPPVIRMKNGDLSPLSETASMTKEDIDGVIEEITSDNQKARFREKHELDFSYHIGNLSRFRVNVYEERNGPAIAFRMIPDKIPAMEQLGLSPAVEQLTHLPYGLVLVTGATGMGKSTTLASMIDAINTKRKAHIITIEDPIEFVYKSKQSLVTQREVNVHTQSFASAIRAALRQDPDVVMVGEMRDLETIAAAVTLAETGHLVFSTLHTTDAAQTVDRIIDVFPPYQQQQIRAQLASTLKGVISQVLLPRADGKGRVAAREILLSNDGIRNCISKGDTHQIYSQIQINRADGMVLMDQSLEDLCIQNVVLPEDAFGKATDPEALMARLQSYQPTK